MKGTIIISTGGTFNKIYNRLTGNLDIDTNNNSLKTIENSWLAKLNFINIINKDSLDFTIKDREELLKTIKKLNYDRYIIIHGTDTIDITAKYLNDANLNKVIVLTGAMVPFSIDPIEATANLAQAIGYSKLASNGIYIALNSVVDRYNRVEKNRKVGKFQIIT